MHDMVIQGATVLDGTGAPPLTADVAVDDGRVVEIGRITSQAREIVKADGLALAPGIVDPHTHFDAQLTWDATASPSPALGVTTVVMGNCGFGIAPCPPHARQTVMRNLAEVEGMPLESLEAGIDWNFESFADYLDLLRDKAPTPNVAAFVGHSLVRSAVMGDAASERTATDDEISSMRDAVRKALSEGAIGFASSQSQNHFGHDGVPMPSRLAADDEIRTLAATLSETEGGLFQITVGPQTTVPFLASIAEETGRPVVFSALFHNDAFPDRASSMLSQCRDARSRGAHVYAQVGCQPLSMEFSLDNPYPFLSLDPWEPLKGADRTTVASAIADPAFRARLRESLSVPVKGKLFYGDWSKVEIAQAATTRRADWEGRTISDLAEAESADPLDLFFDLALEEDFATVFNAKLLNTDEDAIEPLLRHESSMVSLSDAGAHLTYLCDAAYGLCLLGHWTRERGAFTLAEAVRELTSIPADIYGIRGRGRIAPGAYADLLLFDPKTVDFSPLQRRHDLPGGASRLVRDPVGVHGVWVNGTRVFDGSDVVPRDRGPGVVLDSFGI